MYDFKPELAEYKDCSRYKKPDCLPIYELFPKTSQENLFFITDNFPFEKSSTLFFLLPNIHLNPHLLRLGLVPFGPSGTAEGGGGRPEDY
jgi:hypothetical protein